MEEFAIIKSGVNIEACVGGRLWRLHTAGNLEDLWDKIGEDEYGHIPYWVELWPASVAMGAWLNLQANDIRNRPCLDLGCGLGLTALIGQALGAKMLAVDYEPEALTCCRFNANLNNIPQPGWILMDWSEPGLKKGRIERIWASDITYEKAFQKPVLYFLDLALAPDGVAWLADPGRSIFLSFLAKAKESGWEAKPVFTQSVKGGGKTEVTIWQFARVSNME